MQRDAYYRPGRGVIRHKGVSDGSEGACSLWRNPSDWTEMFFADEYYPPGIYLNHRYDHQDRFEEIL
jgi:hypothetical protein